MLDVEISEKSVPVPRFHCSCGKNYKERKELLQHHRDGCWMHEMCHELLPVATSQKTSSWEQQQLHLKNILLKYSPDAAATFSACKESTLSTMATENTCAISEGTADLANLLKSVSGNE